MAYRAFKFVIQPFVLDDADREHAVDPVVVSGGLDGLAGWVEKFPEMLAELNAAAPTPNRAQRRAKTKAK